MISGDTLMLYSGSTGGVKIMDDGSLRNIGTASLFDDLIGDIFSKKLFAVTGTVDFDFDEQAIKFQDDGDITNKNDRLAFNIQVPHSYDDINPFFKIHLHFWQDTSTEHTFKLEYRLQNNGKAKTTTWTTLTASTSSDCKLPYTSGTINQIIEFPAFDTTDIDISSTYQIRFTRDDSDSANDVLVTFADVHYTKIDYGSMTEWSKNG